MAYVAPPTWVTGHIVTAAEMNQYLNANLAALKAEKLEAPLSANSVDSDQYVDGSIDLVHLSALVAARLEAIKVGGLYFSTEATDPATSLGYGTWAAYAAGRIPIGVGTSDAAYGAGAMGGASLHTNTVPEMALHTHPQNSHNHPQDAHNHPVKGWILGFDQGVDSYPLFPDSAGNTQTTSGSTTATNQAATATNQNAGGGAAYNNMPPWIGVYIFRRTA